MSTIAARYYIREAERRALAQRIESAAQQYRRDGSEASLKKLITERDQRAPEETR